MKTTLCLLSVHAIEIAAARGLLSSRTSELDILQDIRMVAELTAWQADGVYAAQKAISANWIA